MMVSRLFLCFVLLFRVSACDGLLNLLLTDTCSLICFYPTGGLVVNGSCSHGRYRKVESLMGPDFFNHWSFYTGPDPTHGNAKS